MPMGDRTGPMGMGPMTGRGFGACRGAVAPMAGRGFGRGFSGGFGRGFGRGRGCGPGFGFGRANYGYGRGYGMYREDEEVLRAYRDDLKSELAEIEKRLLDGEEE